MARLVPEDLERLWRASSSFGGTYHARAMWFANAVMDEMEGLKPIDCTPIQALGLPTAETNALLRAGYQWVEQLNGLGTRDLVRVRQVGLNRAIQIRLAIERWRNGG